jgi:uncharacterized protein
MSRMPSPFGAPQELDYQSSVGTATIGTFFNAVYAWMAAGLALTAVVAWMVSRQPQVLMSLGAGIWLLFIVQLGLVIAISGAINRIGAAVATALFMLYAAINGVLLSVIFLVYAHTTIASAFMVTAGTFGAVSLYGFVTKADLTKYGTFLLMALIGLIIAIVVNMFLRSGPMDTVISCIGVLLFTALTAYDTQKLKIIAIQTENNPAMAARLSITGALTLYLDFINLFLFILRLMGNKRR